ncbi:VWA domain-containing protein [Thalassotalea euphylliae]|uniref:VWA domain-containing protein n=1 Tax=Thalassotalea euphylliae TaxID=1655234 RepID=A0A3E0TPC7_9GAMM|nr:VWA domain-containing protein [Thalassotalea euphylliae]REL26160.1 VWA domain-containing protein [Thalassotalea euphylliae]
MTEFHFIRPLWLLALIALPVIVWLIKRLQVSHSSWSSILPPHLAARMMEQGGPSKGLSVIPACVMYALAILALAGPTWQKLPQPVYQVERGSVIVMDMSYSMYATDLSPNRLTRARFKAVDLLDSLNEGDIGLVAYAGDAFVISPLTQDINNIKLLLPSLSPELMPALGSNPLAALDLAQQMLANAGHVEGDIYWFTDGIDQEDIRDLNDWSAQYPHTVNILGIGSRQGAPIKLPNGELLKDDRGAIVVPRLSDQYLYGVAGKSSGEYQTIRNDNADVEALINNAKLAQEKNESPEELASSEQNLGDQNLGDQWQEAGPYLLVAVLLLLLPYFRRGVLLGLLPAALLLTPSEQALALDWQSLWQTKDQQGQKAFDQQAFEQAAKTFNDPMWKGSAMYKAGDFQGAAKAFAELDSAQGYYNQGNALAKMQQFDEAINAYEQALAMSPEHSDAKANKALIEELKNQQQNQQNSDNDSEQNADNSSDKESQQQGDDSQGDQSQNQQDQQSDAEQNNEQSSDQQDSAQQNSDQQNNAQENNEQNNSQQDQSPPDSGSQQPEPSDSENTPENEQAGDPQAQQSQAPEETNQQAQAGSLGDPQDQEQAQKHQQLLKKVTDDPYLLLRNKMQLEYQKRRQEGSNNGVKKKW